MEWEGIGNGWLYVLLKIFVYYIEFWVWLIDVDYCGNSL